MPRRLYVLTVLALAAGLFLPSGPLAAQQSVPVRAAPVAAFDEDDPTGTVFGGVRFLGGIQLDSTDDRFGGLSGVEISPDGRKVLFVSDVGDLFSATLDYDGGVLAGLSDVAIHRLVGTGGERLGSKESSDAESLRSASGRGLSGRILVGFERDNRVLDYAIDEAGRPHGATRLPLPASAADLPYNQGFEAIAVVPPGAPNAGAVLVFAESERPGSPGVVPGWMIADGKVRDIGLERTSGFDVTDAIALPNGDLIVLERQFSLLLGVAMRLRRIPAAALDGPQPMDGKTLLTAGMAHAIDNMEGLAVHTDTQGRTILTIVSDDNFNVLQRTLILQFELL